MPKATVNRSPRSIGRSPGLSSPNEARGPAVSIRWQDSGVPFQPSSATASRSVMPGRRPRSTSRTPPDVWQRGLLEDGELVDLVDDAQAVGGVDEEVGGVLHGAARAGQPRAARRRGTTGSVACVARLGVRLPADHADPRARPDALVGEDLGRAAAIDPAAGLGRLKSWKRCRRMGRGAAPAMPQHSLPTRIAGSPSGPTTEQRLLEPWVEPGEVREVGAVLPVGVDDEPFEAALPGPARSRSTRSA